MSDEPQKNKRCLWFNVYKDALGELYTGDMSTIKELAQFIAKDKPNCVGRVRVEFEIEEGRFDE